MADVAEVPMKRKRFVHYLMDQMDLILTNELQGERWAGRGRT